jgi:hypothetical protein
MYSLLNWIKNKYFLFIVLNLLFYILNLAVFNAISYVDYSLAIYLCFVELGNRNNIFPLSVINGFILDCLNNHLIGWYLILFFMFFLMSEVYRNYVNFEKLYIRLLFYLSVIIIYINYNLLIYHYPLQAYVSFNVNRLSSDILFVFLLFLLFKRVKSAF